jgi:hypothetical protein
VIQDHENTGQHVWYETRWSFLPHDAGVRSTFAFGIVAWKGHSGAQEAAFDWPSCTGEELTQ